MDLFFTPPVFDGNAIAVLWQYFSAGICVDYSFFMWAPTAGQTQDDFEAAATAAAAAYTSSHSYTVTNIQPWYEHVQKILTVPMYVSGVAKTGSFAVVGAPAVAGGSGTARFYIDSNGDGTGAAPSAVFAASLQAVVINSTTPYVLTNVSVDASRKYIDVTMKALTFTNGLAGLLSVIVGAGLTAAANGTTVNCFVLAQQ